MFVLGDSSNQQGVVGCSFHQDVVETNPGTYIKAWLIRGLSISGVYAENNGRFANFSGAGSNRGVSITGCFISTTSTDSNHYEIVWSSTEQAASAGNLCDKRLHDNDGLALGALRSIGDHADVSLQKSDLLPIVVLPAGSVPAQSGLVPYTGGGQANATQLRAGTNQISTVNASSHSCKLPPAKKGLLVIVINAVALRFELFPYAGDRFRGGTVNVAIEHPAVTTRIYVCGEDGYWNYP